MPCSARLRELTQQALTTLIWGHFSVPVYYLLEHFLGQFQMSTFHFSLNASFSIGFGNGLADGHASGSSNQPGTQTRIAARCQCRWSPGSAESQWPVLLPTQALSLQGTSSGICIVSYVRHTSGNLTPWMKTTFSCIRKPHFSYSYISVYTSMSKTY